MSPSIELRTLRLSDKIAFDQAIDEFKDSDPHWEFAFDYDRNSDFSKYIAKLGDWAEGRNLPLGFVPATFLVATVESKIIGRVALRHKLNEQLIKRGGHIGYGVVPSERRKGYATEMLKMSLSYAKKIGLEKVLITCLATNIASRKIIESCGGVLGSAQTTSDSTVSDSTVSDSTVSDSTVSNSIVPVLKFWITKFDKF